MSNNCEPVHIYSLSKDSLIKNSTRNRVKSVGYSFWSALTSIFKRRMSVQQKIVYSLKNHGDWKMRTNGDCLILKKGRVQITVTRGTQVKYYVSGLYVDGEILGLTQSLRDAAIHFVVANRKSPAKDIVAIVDKDLGF